MSTAIDTMKNFFNVLKLYADDTTINGITVLDHAVRTTTRFSGLQDAINNFIADVNYHTNNFGAAESLKNTCGIVLGADNDYTADTGAVSGSNAGGSTVKNAQDIVPEPDAVLSKLPLPAVGSKNVHSYTGADGNTFSYTVTYPHQYLEVIDVLTAKLDENNSIDYKDVKTTYLQAGEFYTNYDGSAATKGEELATSILNIIRGMESYWLDEALKLNYDSYGLDFNNKNFNIIFGINAYYTADTTPTGHKDIETFFAVDSIDMHINPIIYADIDSSDINGKDLQGINRYLDRVIAHEITHAVMFAGGLFKESMPEFFTEGVAELTQGIDDYNGELTEIILKLASDPERLTKAMPLKAGTGTIDSYPAGYMFLRYLCQQSLPVNVETGPSTESKIFTHSTSQDIISDYKNSDQINLAAGVQITNENHSTEDLFISSNLGIMILRDARGKVLNFADENGNIQSRGLVANWAGTIDLRGYTEKEMVCGADNLDNDIWAGDGGSRLWGGSYGNDKLIGGAGADEFIAGVGCGNDLIFKAGSEDTINLIATTLDQISNIAISTYGVNLSFTDGGNLYVSGNVGATFKLADGSTYIANQSSGEWTKN